MDTTETSAALRPGKGYRRIFAILVIPPILFCWFIWGPLVIVSYVSGLFNSMRGFLILMPLALVVVGSLPAFPMLAMYTAVTWRRRTRFHRRALVFWIVLTGGFACPYLIGFAGLTPSPFEAYVRGFTRYAKAKADVGAIQNWLATLDPNDYKEPGAVLIERILKGSEQPPSIARLHPGMARLLLDNSGHLTVRLLWGGGFIGHWGIMVGPKDMPMPLFDSDQPWLLLRPGAYVWSSD